MIELYYRDTLIGTIKNQVPDELAMVGEIDFTPAAADYNHVFDLVNDPQKRIYESPHLSEELIENWFIEDAFGNRAEILTPAVNEKNEIWWR